jgi:hypothetical protein
MDNLDNPIDDLIAQFKQLENASPSPSRSVKSCYSGTKSMAFVKNYGIYLLFFVYLVVLILALQPFPLFLKDETTQKYKFLWKRFFITLFVSYAILVGLYLGFQFYVSKL